VTGTPKTKSHQMKHFIPLSLIALAPLLAFAAEGHVHKADGSCCSDVSKFVEAPGSHTHAAGENPRVSIKANQVANLAIKSVKIGPAKIARTAFALGDIDADPRGESSAASRIAGRVVELKVALGDTVKKGDTLAVLESRQPGGEPAKVAITALAHGTVTEVLTRLGDPVSPDAPLLRLADHTRLVAEARIPQRHANDLTPGMTLARLTPEGGDTREVTLDSLAPTADPVTGTVTARFLIDNADGSLTPGRRAEFRVVLSEKEFPVTVPREAIQGEKGDLFVFIEETPGVYEKHPVIVGESDERTVAVTGPEAGEKVVSHGGYSLRYATPSNVSLREAMDAAHGHKHGPNGEEPDADHAEGDGHDHAGHKHGTEVKPVAGATTHAEHDHDHKNGDDHDHAAHAKEITPAKPVVGKNALQAELDAAHGHAHGPDGEELGEHDAAKNTPTFFTGDSGCVFFATLAAGEAILLGLALTALRRKQAKEVVDA
jgi:cobalt-zinc-cadmium efflux system membrane fusion protein